MAIPPQEVAKVVLGYLREEGLRTVYDEFLRASPHLDAQSESDSIWMRSLQSILSEYRAVAIHVEDCEPMALRQKLSQFTNLLEKVKFLVNHIDISKLQTDVTQERVRVGNIKHDVTDISSEVIDVDPIDSSLPSKTEEKNLEVGKDEERPTNPSTLQGNSFFVTVSPPSKLDLKTYAKDELIAMPTIYLVPPSEPSGATTTTNVKIFKQSRRPAPPSSELQ